MAEDPTPQREFPRELTAHERATLDFILSVEDVRLAPLREQATSALVSGLCGCGCASIQLVVDRSVAPRAGDLSRERIYSATIVDPREAYFLDLLLDDGWLSWLEISWIETPPAEFPPIEIWPPPRVSDRAGDASTTTGVLSTLRRLLGRPAQPSRS